MILIGLVGEAPSDTQAIQSLLEPYFEGSVTFINLLENFHGSQLDNQKTKNFLRKEYQDKKPAVVIFIRDLDALERNRRQKRLRQEYFSASNSVVDNTGIFLLNIFELEALILADLDGFNQTFQCSATFSGDPTKQKEPKEWLMMHTSKFDVSANPLLFSLLKINLLQERCKYFKLFLARLHKLINSLNSNRSS